MPEPIYRIQMHEQPSAPAPAPGAGKSSASYEPVDVAADDTIGKQVEDELRISDEENLLKRG